MSSSHAIEEPDTGIELGVRTSNPFSLVAVNEDLPTTAYAVNRLATSGYKKLHIDDQTTALSVVAKPDPFWSRSGHGDTTPQWYSTLTVTHGIERPMSSGKLGTLDYAASLTAYYHAQVQKLDAMSRVDAIVVVGPGTGRFLDLLPDVRHYYLVEPGVSRYQTNTTNITVIPTVMNHEELVDQIPQGTTFGVVCFDVLWMSGRSQRFLLTQLHNTFLDPRCAWYTYNVPVRYGNALSYAGELAVSGIPAHFQLLGDEPMVSFNAAAPYSSVKNIRNYEDDLPVDLIRDLRQELLQEDDYWLSVAPSIVRLNREVLAGDLSDLEWLAFRLDDFEFAHQLVTAHGYQTKGALLSYRAGATYFPAYAYLKW
jgi:hypothetical protein